MSAKRNSWYASLKCRKMLRFFIFFYLQPAYARREILIYTLTRERRITAITISKHFFAVFLHMQQTFYPSACFGPMGFFFSFFFLFILGGRFDVPVSHPWRVFLIIRQRLNFMIMQYCLKWTIIVYNILLSFVILIWSDNCQLKIRMTSNRQRICI